MAITFTQITPRCNVMNTQAPIFHVFTPSGGIYIAPLPLYVVVFLRLQPSQTKCQVFNGQ